MAFHKVSKCEGAKIGTVEAVKSKEDLRRIYQWMYDHDLEKYAILFRVGCYTGLRASDVLGLKVKDVWKQDKVLIREQKTGKVKKFPLNAFAREPLIDYIKRKGLQEEDLIFMGRTENKEVHRSQVYRWIVQACLELGIEGNYGTHTMRKTFGYHHYKQFKDVAILMEILNHASPDVTLRYIGITQDEIDRTYYELNLEEDISTFQELVDIKGNNKSKLRSIISLCKNYLNKVNFKGRYSPFVQLVLDLAQHTPEYIHQQKAIPIE